MGCDEIDLGNGGVAFVCSRGKRVQKCKFCNDRTARFLCDEPLRGEKEGQTCSAPMCAHCARSVATNVHLCPPHQRRYEANARAAKEADEWLAKLIANEGAPVPAPIAPIEGEPTTFDDALAGIEHERRRRAQVPIGEKVAHVKAARQSRDHDCHWPGCEKQIPPAMHMCKDHWYLVPKEMRDKLWAAYAPGQENSLTPSRAYLAVFDEIQEWIHRQDGQRAGKWNSVVRRVREADARRNKGP